MVNIIANKIFGFPYSKDDKYYQQNKFFKKILDFLAILIIKLVDFLAILVNKFFAFPYGQK
jgi:hypothetical protein